MSFAPTWDGPVYHPFRYAIVYTGKEGGEGGTVEGLFSNKTFADACCNTLNEKLGEGYYAVAKIFQRRKG